MLLGTREEPYLFECFGFVRNRQPAATPGEGLKSARPGVSSLPFAGCGDCRALQLICVYLTLRRLRFEANRVCQ